MAYNVKVVYDVSGVAIKKLRSSFSNPRNVAEKKSTKGGARLGFFVARAALAAKRIQSCYVQVFCSSVSLSFLFLALFLFSFLSMRIGHNTTTVMIIFNINEKFRVPLVTSCAVSFIEFTTSS
jgi:hypothetical protein